MKVYINAKIITMDGEKVIPNGALLVDGSKITAVLTMDEYSAPAPASSPVPRPLTAQGR